MNKCKYCNKRIWLSKYWCLKCLEKIVDEITSNKKEKKIMKEKNYKIGKINITIKIYDEQPSIKIERQGYGRDYLSLSEFRAVLRYQDKFIQKLTEFEQELLEQEVLEGDEDNE